jgi:hypothetical protein
LLQLRSQLAESYRGKAGGIGLRNFTLLEKVLAVPGPGKFLEDQGTFPAVPVKGSIEFSVVRDIRKAPSRTNMV